MRFRTTAAMCGTALLLLGATVAHDAPRARDAGPRAAAQDSLPPFRLEIGDTIRLALRGGHLRLTIASGPGGGIPAIYHTSAPARVSVTADGRVTALAAGLATVSALAAGDSATFPILVVDPRQAANWTATEVCPNDFEERIRARQPISSEVEPIHEFHDCQRLIQGGEYTVLAGIFAHQVIAGHISYQDFQQPRIVATIMNLAMKDKPAYDYPSLHLAPGTNCLVLQATGANDWHAVIVHQLSPVFVRGDSAPTYETCDPRMLARSSSVPRSEWLEVKLQKGVDLDGRPIAPPVARWDWDPKNKLNYIGIKCEDDTWCEIGPRQFTRSDPIWRTRFGWPIRAEIFKGYYDQQYLADTSGKHPSMVFGTIMPDEDLKRSRTMDYKKRRWYRAVHLEFEQRGGTDASAYLMYVKSYLDPTITTVGDDKEDTSYQLRPDTLKPPHWLWDGKSNDHSLGNEGVLYHRHKALAGMPPIVRWRWKEKDEGTWSYCAPEGCCENVKVLGTP